jgi:hypothetical protein
MHVVTKAHVAERCSCHAPRLWTRACCKQMKRAGTHTAAARCCTPRSCHTLLLLPSTARLAEHKWLANTAAATLGSYCGCCTSRDCHTLQLRQLCCCHRQPAVSRPASDKSNSWHTLLLLRLLYVALLPHSAATAAMLLPSTNSRVETSG